MKIKAVLITGISVILSQGAMAAKPTSITFKETKTNSDDVQYQLYVIKCSDGISHEITAWNNRKLWCVGDSMSEPGCEKKQIKIAKKVCKSS
jgi:hypothetical protein